MPFRYILFCYHLIFSLIFYAYIMEYGGDALGYWTMQADSSQGAESWMQHWGLGTFFVQWLNYVPSQLLGMPFWAGNLLYGLISAFAWLAIFQRINKVTETVLPRFTRLIWLLPNMHFWTAGVGKESLIWMFFVLFILNLKFRKQNMILCLAAVFLMFLVRPLYASFLLFILLFFWLKNSPYTPKQTILGTLVLVLGLGFVTSKLLLFTHMEALNLENIKAYIQFQQEFLMGFKADTYLPMEQYAFPWAFLSFLFRPMPWEGTGILFILAGLENLFAVLLVTGALMLGVWKQIWSKNEGFIYGIIFLFLISVVGSLTLNNFGIMLRYKSPAMIFLYLWALDTIFSGLKLILAKQNNK
ncbi:hypothetical protein A33Q_1451 [Indibacter alkaliphilus LW1]|uniref:Glycosyltransferase RgtA/B/C/D-like domain-containing protein n=1 Tax=Indibacter alkaliphilus (strain CCUG 57479 / KCTC 22604 / LW1) TaxID=1189612 RepID=S2DIG5_INDAL|nr:hypothetical protein [Indibacter alkaliphilus]EOZ98797.1 hypothetical protein A33Q_1451 [Indibacter alkaliphilus LW1]